MSAAEQAQLLQRADVVRAAFNAEFYDGSCAGGSGCYRSAAHRQRAGGTTNCTTKLDNCTLPDDRVNALAIVTGLAPASRWAPIAKAVLHLESPFAVAFGSTAMEKFALEALFLAGEPDAALARMLTRFGPMIKHNLTTLWEHWEVDPETGAPIAGYNHGWSGGGLVLLSQYVKGALLRGFARAEVTSTYFLLFALWLPLPCTLRYVAGLAPTAPGWTRFDVRPQLGSGVAALHNASARVATPLGQVSVDVSRTGGQEGIGGAPTRGKRLQVRLNVPEGAAARLVLPRSMGRVMSYTVEPALQQDKMKFNTEGGIAADAASSIVDAGLRLPAGSWVVEARY